MGKKKNYGIYIELGEEYLRNMFEDMRTEHPDEELIEVCIDFQDMRGDRYSKVFTLDNLIELLNLKGVTH